VNIVPGLQKETYMKIIIAPTNGIKTVTLTADVHHPRRFRRQDLAHYQVGKEEVPQMIDDKGHLEAIYRPCPIDPHDTSVVDKDIDPGHIVPAEDGIRCLADGSE
jgi:hypothetical protein